jgi:hypothetical protein
MDHRTEILNLLYLYQERFDQGDVEGIGEIFSQAVLRGEDGVNSWTGPEKVAALFRGLLQLYNGSPRTTHTTLNTILEVDEEAGTAATRSVYVVYQQTDDLPLQPIVTGRYYDRFRLRDGKWEFAERVFVQGLQGDLSRHQTTHAAS